MFIKATQPSLTLIIDNCSTQGDSSRGGGSMGVKLRFLGFLITEHKSLDVTED